MRSTSESESAELLVVVFLGTQAVETTRAKIKMRERKQRMILRLMRHLQLVLYYYSISLDKCQ